MDAASVPIRTERRLSTRRIGDRPAQFAIRLTSNAEWMKRFLHRGK